MKTILLFIAASIILYLSGAFANASFNISHWGEVSRWMVSIIWCILACGMGYEIYYDEE